MNGTHRLAACGGLAALLATLSGGAELRKGALRLVAESGRAGVAIFHDAAICAELALVPAGAAVPAPLRAADVRNGPDDDASLHVASAAAEADIVPGDGPFVTVRPGSQATRLEVRCGARYALLPDFFADDTIFDPVKLPSPRLTIPAENMLLQFVDGGNVIVMCMWGAGRTNAPAAEPAVDLLVSGEGAARRIQGVSIEFLDRPVHIGIIAHAGVWRDQELTSWPAYQLAPVPWKRPFDARWRADFVVADGQTLRDWPNRIQSFDVRFLPEEKPAAGWDRAPGRWWGRGAPEAPTIWQEHLVDHILYPAVFRGEETQLAAYVDKQVRRAQAKDKPLTHVYERALVYPLDRVQGTPGPVFTPVDLMRMALGQGPCEYVLDVAGIKGRGAGAGRPLLADSTCALWMEHVFPISGKLKDVKAEALDAKTRERLIQALEDMWFFVRAVHDRIREYKAWGVETEAVLKATTAPRLKPAAERALARIKALNNDVGSLKFEGPGTEGDWKVRLAALQEKVRSGEATAAEIGSVGQIRNLGNRQDQMVSRCRQYVKGIHQELLLLDASDPEMRAFAAGIRERCQRILRNSHPKECL